MSQLKIKQEIRQAVESNDHGRIISLVQQNRSALSPLIRMAYDKETLEGWRAIKAIGHVAKSLVGVDDEFLRLTIRKLLWSLSDESGGIGWSAPEILGEIVSADPGKLSDIIPLIAGVYDIEEDVFRAGVVYALARIAEIAPERVANQQKIIILSLIDTDPLVRINGLELVRRLWSSATENNLWTKEYIQKLRNVVENMKKDKGVAWKFYEDGFICIEVGELAIIIGDSVMA